MAKLIMGIGLAGSGKTTTLKAFAGRYGYAFVDIQDVRERHGTKANELSTKSSWDELRQLVREHLQQNETVVVESSFVNGPDRRKFLEFARNCGARKIQAVFLDTPHELAWERNTVRERNIPREVFDERIRMLNEHPPAMEDGFDGLYTIDEYQTLVEAETRDEKREFKWGNTEMH